MSWIDEQLDEGEEILASGDAARADRYIRETCGLLVTENVPSPRAGLRTRGQRVGFYGANGWSGTTFSHQDYLDDVRTVMKKLRMLAERNAYVECETSRPKSGEAMSVNIETNPHITVSPNIEASANAESSTLSEQSLAQQIDRTCTVIEYSDGLNPAEKAEATQALTDAKRAAQSGDYKTLADKLGKALEIAGKGVGVAKAVLEVAPMIIGLLPPA